MSRDEQSDVIAFLGNPATHGGTAPVERITTHISEVFLAGDRALKLKRVVTLPYADFSTPERRLAFCEREYALNRATAPRLYKGVRRIMRTAAGGLVFDGDGALADAVVEMVRFDQSALFDRLAVAGRLDPALMGDLAGIIARFHAGAPIVHSGSGSHRMARVLDLNRAAFSAGGVFAPDEVAALDRAFRQRLERYAEVLDARAAAGMVRRCHGDLHLRNICLLDGRATLFDCIDFNDELATVDVLYDLAFLLMDLWHRDLAVHANLVANRYFDQSGSDAGFHLLGFFMAVRAAIRAHVMAMLAGEAGGDRDRQVSVARSYFDLARELLAERPAQIVAIGGFSGSGKSSVAEALAPLVGTAPGARVIESDRTRKAMFGVPSDTRLGEDAYRAQVSEEVYRRLGLRARALAEAGANVVVNAVYDRPALRADLAEAAAGAPFSGFWLAADADILRQRVRQRSGGSSDATVDVLEAQLARDPGTMTWRAIASDRPVATTVQAIVNALNGQAR